MLHALPPPDKNGIAFYLGSIKSGVCPLECSSARIIVDTTSTELLHENVIDFLPVDWKRNQERLLKRYRDNSKILQAVHFPQRSQIMRVAFDLFSEFKPILQEETIVRETCFKGGVFNVDDLGFDLAVSTMCFSTRKITVPHLFFVKYYLTTRMRFLSLLRLQRCYSDKY